MRAFHRGYSSQRVTRLHIERPADAVKTPHRSEYRRYHPQPSVEGWCSTSALDHTNSPVIWLDTIPAEPPPGLKWCPNCVGRAAEWLGTLGPLAAMLAAADQATHTEG